MKINFATRKISAWFWLASLINVILITGCQTPSGLSRLTITDEKEIKNEWPKPKEHFVTGEIAVARVIGCEGKNISLQVIDSSSGKIVRQRSEFFPKPRIEIDREKITVDHPYGAQDEPMDLVRSRQINIYTQRFFLFLDHLPAGSYETQLLIEGKLAEKSSFIISN